MVVERSPSCKRKRSGYRVQADTLLIVVISPTNRALNRLLWLRENAFYEIRRGFRSIYSHSRGNLNVISFDFFSSVHWELVVHYVELKSGIFLLSG